MPPLLNRYAGADFGGQLRNSSCPAEDCWDSRKTKDSGDYSICQSESSAIQGAGCGCVEDAEARADDSGIARIPGPDDPNRDAAFSGVYQGTNSRAGNRVFQGIRRV